MPVNHYKEQNWTRFEKFFFYFAFFYFIFYAFSFPLDKLIYAFNSLTNWLYKISGWHFFNSVNEGINILLGSWKNLWHWLIPLISKNIFHITIAHFPAGSGDTAYNYIEMVVMTVFSLAGAAVFTAKKERNHHIKHYSFLFTAMRFYLAFSMLHYGFAKVIQTQFPYPSLSMLTQTIGETPPMGLAWNFVGYSYGLNLFVGCCEIAGATLLFFRKTVTAGALLGITICTSVFVINLCYDIPVKLHAAHLLLFSVFIAAGDFKRIKQFFSGNATADYTIPSFFSGSKQLLKKQYIKWGIVLFFIWVYLSDSIFRYQLGMGATKTPLYGIYNLKSKTVNNNIIPVYYGDSTTWKQIIIDRPGYIKAQLANDSSIWYKVFVDTSGNFISIHSETDTGIIYRFHYHLENDFLNMKGRIKNDSTEFIFRRYDENKFILNSRGFHWMNEYPYIKR